MYINDLPTLTYACMLTTVGDPRGVRSCYGYGDSFLQVCAILNVKTFISIDYYSPTLCVNHPVEESSSPYNLCIC